MCFGDAYPYHRRDRFYRAGADSTAARADHQVTAWVRDGGKACALLSPDVTLAASGDPAALKEAIAEADAIINLAGEPVMGARWTSRRKMAIMASRIDLTRAIAQAIAECTQRPVVLISASAVGYYGDLGDDLVEDDAPPGTDFLARLCREWEAAAIGARPADVRVFIPRIGIVLGRDGGALAKMIVPFRFGLGGPVGSGRQYVPWIHLDDLVQIITIALTDSRFAEPMIAAAPESGHKSRLRQGPWRGVASTNLRTGSRDRAEADPRRSRDAVADGAARPSTTPRSGRLRLALSCDRGGAGGDHRQV
ncbi:MAG TPA: TIGR01777 family oxidoreductase [Candidatus Binataceae bacterium]|nr:TIGR01777 family oxidoreductase [Candidatus Binataceae bacterium]